MNEQEKTLQGIIEFCQWLIPNAKQLGLEQSKSIAMIKQAQTPNDIINGMNSLYQELGEEQFTALAQAFQQSKAQNIQKAKAGSKLEYLVNKFDLGNKIKPYKKPAWMPWNIAFDWFADAVDLPKRDPSHDPREHKRVTAPSGEMRDQIIKKNGTGSTERRVSPDKRDTVFYHNFDVYHKGDEMYDRYQNAWKEYGVYDDGGSIDKPRKIDERVIDLVEKMTETAILPSTVTVDTINPNIRTAKSGRDVYTLQTNGRDSMMWWRPNGLDVVLSNSGPNNSWVGYTQIMEDDGPTSVQLSEPMMERMKPHMFKKLKLK